MTELIKTIHESVKEGLESLVGLIDKIEPQKLYSPNQLVDFYSELYDLGTDYISTKQILIEKTQEREDIQLLSKLTRTPDRMSRSMVKELAQNRRSLEEYGQRIKSMFNKIELIAYNQICLDTQVQNSTKLMNAEQILTAHSTLLDKTPALYKNVRNNTYEILIKAELI